jgi:hypothetical protein
MGASIVLYDKYTKYSFLKNYCPEYGRKFPDEHFTKRRAISN